MTKFLALILILAGIFLLALGYDESQTLGSRLNRLFSGELTQRAMIYYIGGGVCLLLGILGLARR
ncbi:MAG: DUF3185 family protein [Gammaproteobacteria bacterium]|nr:DUF3185 family protein [Gammaproteobacteria bacterium]MDH5651055.1 DUF3185 family protein [Gammaproteobacteria bacterium]